jgi:diguanylate cyclase (GGDEF)-like protein
MQTADEDAGSGVGSSGGDVRRRPGRGQPPLDVRRHEDAGGSDTTLVEAVLDALSSPTLLVEPDGTILLVNEAWARAAELVDDDRLRVGVGGDYFAMALRVRDDDGTRLLIEAVREVSRGEREMARADCPVAHPTGTRWYHVQATRVDQSGRIVVTHTDVTSRVNAEKAATWQARHDSLTQLPNRPHLHELIDIELRRPGRGTVAVLFIDVDGFKDLNDSLGHDVGDELLRQVAARLTSATRSQDTVGRLGGDEFVILCRDSDSDRAELLARRIQATFETPFDLAGCSARLSASIGIADVAAADPVPIRSTELVRDADLAMYAAKVAGRNRIRVFSPDLRSTVQQKVQLASELREAIEADQLVLHYQPVVHLPSGACTGVEALVRWQHPERGLLPPSEFIALAEQHELIVPLTRWVLRTAARQGATWDAIGLPLIMAVNISAEHFPAGTLVDDVGQALTDAGLHPSRLLVELTETSVTEDPVRAAAQLAELRVSGVEVAIDDFGSGFTSISQLASVPAGVLKIDRSLVSGTGSGAGQWAAAMVAITGLASAFGMRSLAEGVETAGQMAAVGELGCSFAQGFHIARPMPAQELTAWLRARRASEQPPAVAGQHVRAARTAVRSA